MMEKNRKLFIICFLSFILILLCGCTKLLEKTEKQVEQVETQLSNESKENLEETIKQEDKHIENNLCEIHDISKYPYIVQGNGEINVEIFSSANYAKEKWLIDVINKFNQRKNLVDGKSVSISLKIVPTEIIFENISEGKCSPDAITPENQYLAEMLQVKGVEYYQESEVLLKNVLGIVIDESTYNFLLKNQKDVEFIDIQQAMINDEINIGILYEDINSLSFIVSMLYSFDSENILSNESIQKFKQFETNLINISNIADMSDYIESGKINAAILDYNSYVNTSELTEYIFIPFGVVNNNPLYSGENISEQEKRVIKLFGYYATSIHSKKLAKEYGFITNGNNVSEIPDIDGETLLEIREFFDNKI